MTNIVNWNPFEEFDNFFRQGSAAAPRSSNAAWHPVVDISENKDSFHIHVELPAVKKQDVKLRLEKGFLVLEGERKLEKESGETTQYHRIERSYGRFQRTFALPDGVDEQQVDAKHNDGVLTITIKKKEVEPERLINIQS